MQFKLRYALPDHYHSANLADDAKMINHLITADEDDVLDMLCTADMGELVFDGFCEVEDLPSIAKLCDQLIFEVTDERGE